MSLQVQAGNTARNARSGAGEGDESAHTGGAAECCADKGVTGGPHSDVVRAQANDGRCGSKRCSQGQLINKRVNTSVVARVSSSDSASSPGSSATSRPGNSNPAEIPPPPVAVAATAAATVWLPAFREVLSAGDGIDPRETAAEERNMPLLAAIAASPGSTDEVVATQRRVATTSAGMRAGRGNVRLGGDSHSDSAEGGGRNGAVEIGEVAPTGIIGKGRGGGGGRDFLRRSGGWKG